MIRKSIICTSSAFSATVSFKDIFSHCRNRSSQSWLPWMSKFNWKWVLSRIIKNYSINIQYDDTCPSSILAFKICTTMMVTLVLKKAMMLTIMALKAVVTVIDACPSSIAASEIWSTMVNPRGASQEAAYWTPVFTLLAPLPGKTSNFVLFRQNYLEDETGQNCSKQNLH